MHDASFFGIPEVVALLIANGADVKATNNYGFTPLYKAKQNLKFHTDLLKENADSSDYHSKKSDDLGKVIGILSENGVKNNSI